MSDKITYTLEQARYAAEQKLDEAWLKYRDVIVRGGNGSKRMEAKDQLGWAIEGMDRALQVIRETEAQIVKMLENQADHKS